MKTTFFNSLKITFSVVGAVIGAGFITGREIVRFFYGMPIFAAAGAEFLLFFSLFYFLLTVKDNAFFSRAVKFANVCVYIISFFIIASMLGATDSLFFEAFGVPYEIPVGSIALLVFATAVCFGGIEKIEKANGFIVPFMILATVAVLIAFGEKSSQFVPFDAEAAASCVSYGAMNALLSQPFFLKLKKGYTAVNVFKINKKANENAENKQKISLKSEQIATTATKNSSEDLEKAQAQRPFSPFLVSLFSSLALALLIALYLKSIDEYAALKDVPVLFIAGNSEFLRIVIAGLIACGIITTQFSTEYPLVCLASKKKRSRLLLLVGAVAVFTVSRLGFYVIVDVIYPAVAAFAAIYYAVLIFATTVIFPLKSRINTSARRERKGVSYSSLPNRGLKPARRKR